MQIVGIVLSNIVDFLSPEIIVLGGGVTDSMPELVCAEVMAGIQAHSTSSSLRDLKVVAAKHAGLAVTIGAAKFTLDLKKSRPSPLSSPPPAHLGQPSPAEAPARSLF